MDSTAEKIYQQLSERYKESILLDIENYNQVFKKYLFFIAKGEADIYVKIISVNEDSYGEKESIRLLEALKEAEQKLKYSINAYERINQNKEKIITKLNPIIQENHKRMQTIINGIATGEFSYS